MNVAATPSGMPRIPSVVKNMWDAMRSSEYPRCDMKPGKYAPK